MSVIFAGSPTDAPAALVKSKTFAGKALRAPPAAFGRNGNKFPFDPHLRE